MKFKNSRQRKAVMAKMRLSPREALPSRSSLAQRMEREYKDLHRDTWTATDWVAAAGRRIAYMYTNRFLLDDDGLFEIEPSESQSGAFSYKQIYSAKELMAIDKRKGQQKDARSYTYNFGDKRSILQKVLGSSKPHKDSMASPVSIYSK